MFTRLLRCLLFLTASAVAAALAVAGSSKFADPGPALSFLKLGFHIPVPSGVWIVHGIAVVELLLGFALAYGNGRWLWPSIASLILVGAFVGMLIEVHLRHPHVAIQCGCFGALQAPLGGESILSHLRLNAVLLALLVTHVGLYGIYRRRLKATPYPVEGSPLRSE